MKYFLIISILLLLLLGVFNLGRYMVYKNISYLDKRIELLEYNQSLIYNLVVDNRIELVKQQRQHNQQDLIIRGLQREQDALYDLIQERK